MVPREKEHGGGRRQYPGYELTNGKKGISQEDKKSLKVLNKVNLTLLLIIMEITGRTGLNKALTNRPKFEILT